jgi:hypothetical protein
MCRYLRSCREHQGDADIEQVIQLTYESPLKQQLVLYKINVNLVKVKKYYMFKIYWIRWKQQEHASLFH